LEPYLLAGGSKLRNGLRLPGVFFLEGRKNMLVRYKKNKKPACYDSDVLLTTCPIPAAERPKGPFKSCGNCPYPSHGFICYSSEGDCLRTDMQKINKKPNAKQKLI
jgi:hypothetical protein